MKVQIQKKENSYEVSHIRSSIKRDLNRENTAKISIVRDEVDFELEESKDEVQLLDGSTKIFGGLLEDIDRRDGFIQLFVESFERYARDSKPVENSYSFDGDTDKNIIIETLKKVDTLAHGDSESRNFINQVHSINNVDSEIQKSFSNVSPAKVIRKVRDITGGELKYTPDKKLIYKNEFGSDKTGTVISPRKKNISNINIQRRGGDDHATHIRMIGGGADGQDRTVVDIEAQNFNEATDREIWTSETDISITSESTLERKGRQIIEEKYNATIDVTAIVRNIDINLGDRFTINYPQKGIEEQEFRAVEFDEIFDNKGHRYNITFSNVSQNRKLVDEKIQQKIERGSREGKSKLGIEVYEQLSDAPKEEGLYYIKGPDPEEWLRNNYKIWHKRYPAFRNFYFDNIYDKYNEVYFKEVYREIYEDGFYPDQFVEKIFRNFLSTNLSNYSDDDGQPFFSSPSAVGLSYYSFYYQKNYEEFEERYLLDRIDIRRGNINQLPSFYQEDDGQSGESLRGIYRWDPWDNEFKRGGNQDIAELQDLDIRGRNITNNGSIVYDGENDQLGPGLIKEAVDDIKPLEHGNTIDSPPNAHHQSPSVSIGTLTCDPERAPDYIEYVSVDEFKPKYIEFYATFIDDEVGDAASAEYNSNEDMRDIVTGHSYGYGTGSEDTDQFYHMTMSSPGLQQANKSAVDYGSVCKISYEDHIGSGASNTEEVELEIYSIYNNGFRVVWTENDRSTGITYRAYR